MLPFIDESIKTRFPVIGKNSRSKDSKFYVFLCKSEQHLGRRLSPATNSDVPVVPTQWSCNNAAALFLEWNGMSSSFPHSSNRELQVPTKWNRHNPTTSTSLHCSKSRSSSYSSISGISMTGLSFSRPPSINFHHPSWNLDTIFSACVVLDFDIFDGLFRSI